ncbi:MAG: amino acid adenylation domain-containing protein, partial [Candidatus Azotimanducaceae bacterium]
MNRIISTTSSAFELNLADKEEIALLTGEKPSTIQWLAGQRFHHLFEDIVDGFGAAAKNAVAIEFTDETYTYADLEALANKLARYFAAQGVRSGDRVAIQFDRTIHAYASLLAISKLGAVFIPLDIGFPTSRIEHILKDSDVSLVVTLSFYTSQFSGLGLPILALDAAQAEYEKLSPRRLSDNQADAQDDALAYLIYTSGTTGLPKGVQIAHSSIVNFLQVAQDCYGFQQDDRVYQSLSLAFDYAFEEIWVPLLSGARLIPAPVGVNLLGADLVEFLTSRKITAYCCVPTILATIESDLPNLRLLITSGEACPRDLAARWLKEGRRVLNLYGPTETTVSATWGELEPGKDITIGGPLPTYTTMILDPDEPRLLNRGETGELAIAGIGVSTGYMNRPEETDRAFIKDFIGIENNPGGKIYRSGDLARISDSNEIEYIGRKDTQVKIRGYRIELGEIEVVVREVSGLGEVVVNPAEIEEGQEELVVYYVPNADGLAPEPAEIHDALKDRLPSYMVPSYYEKLENTPLMPSGKVDRSKLPAPSQARLTETGKSFVEPKEGVEADLAALLATILKVEKVSADADFFTDLGANSLIMARYLGKVRKTLGLKGASMRQIYEHPNIANFAVAIAPPIAPSLEPQAAEQSEGVVLTQETSDATPEAAIAVMIGEPEGTPEALSTTIPLVDGIKYENDLAQATSSAEEPLYIASRLQFILCGVYQVSYMLFSAFLAALCIDLGF